MGIKEKSIKAYTALVEGNNFKHAEAIEGIKKNAQEYVKKHLGEDVSIEDMEWLSPNVEFTIDGHYFVYNAIDKHLHMVGVCSDCGCDVLSTALFSPADIGYIFYVGFLPREKHECSKKFDLK